ncbi:MAG TPA: class I SAM-dependent methyltransferase [Candidatus Babeliales bacterium]|nr:class I SAM-dependent methyltransferase [Candidatus Babeliales bacterium]
MKKMILPIFLGVLHSSLTAAHFSAKSIEEVKKFWDRRPCNLKHSKKPIGTREYFDEVEKRKYFVEPHIPGFAEFAMWRGKRVLEIGCGLGTEAINFARNGADLTIVELSPESLELAKKRFELYGLSARFILGNAQELDQILHGEKYDLIWSFGVIHHSPQPEKIVKACNSLLKDDGELRMMVYSKISYKLFHFMRETGMWDFGDGALDELIAMYSEAQTGCPVTYSYTFEGARRLFGDFEILEMKKDHIFPWKIEKYIKYEYEKEDCFKNVSDELFKELEAELGWHLMIRAKKKNS